MLELLYHSSVLLLKCTVYGWAWTQLEEQSPDQYGAGVEFRQKIYLSDGQVDLQNHLSEMKSTCPTQENHKIKRLFNVAP